MKYYSIILALAMTFLGAQAVQAQTVLERFPIDRSTCTGGISVSAYFDNGNGSNKDWNIKCVIASNNTTKIHLWLLSLPSFRI